METSVVAEETVRANSSVRVIDYAMYGFMATSILVALKKQGVFDFLIKNGFQTSISIASALDLNVNALTRILDASIIWGLIEKKGNKYSISIDVKPHLDDSNVEYKGFFIEHLGNNTIPISMNLDKSMEDGEPQWNLISKRIHSGESEHAFSNIFDSEVQARNFHTAMWNLSYEPSVEVIRKDVLKDVESLVDLGGGLGAFAIAAANETDIKKIQVFDLPEVQPHFENSIAQYEVADRISFVAGNFWESRIPENVDLVVIGYILSDWNDEKAIELLRKIYRSLKEGGRVLIMERLIEEDKVGPFCALMQDIAMMVETGGMHRTQRHYESLLKQSGFSDCRIVLSSGEKHAILGYKKSINFKYSSQTC